MSPDKPRARSLGHHLDSFPLGRTPLVMLVLFLISAGVVRFGGRSEEGQYITHWTPWRVHYEDYVVAKKRFEAAETEEGARRVGESSVLGPTGL